MMAAMLCQYPDWIGEGEPFINADGQMIFSFELLHREEVVPLREVLRAGDAVSGGVGKGEREGAFALSRCGRRNDFKDHVHGGVFAHDAGKRAFAVVVELA